MLSGLLAPKKMLYQMRSAKIGVIRNVFDFWSNLVLNYPWEPVPIAQRFFDSLRLWKVIRHEKC